MDAAVTSIAFSHQQRVCVYVCVCFVLSNVCVIAITLWPSPRRASRNTRYFHTLTYSFTNSYSHIAHITFSHTRYYNTLCCAYTYTMHTHFIWHTKEAHWLTMQIHRSFYKKLWLHVIHLWQIYCLFKNDIFCVYKRKQKICENLKQGLNVPVSSVCFLCWVWGRG